jgi:hypothetical protein
MIVPIGGVRARKNSRGDIKQRSERGEDKAIKMRKKCFVKFSQFKRKFKKFSNLSYKFIFL